MCREKLGLIYDAANNVIAFSESLNETESAFINNYEIVDVFTSREDNDRVSIKEKDFDRLWDNNDSSAKIYDFPKMVKEKIISYKDDEVDSDIDNKEFIKDVISNDNVEKLKTVTNSPEIPAGVSLHDY